MVMDLKSQRMIAAKLMKCGKSRVWLDPARSADISEAITAGDIRKLINDGVITTVPKKGLSSFRKKKKAAQKKKGRMRNRGSFKGAMGTRNNKKKVWMKTIRAIRSLLRDLKAKKEVDNKTYRKIYTMSKSGFFRSRAHVMIYLERNSLLRKHQEKLSEEHHTEKK
jgi:large subunit ribosomal protein L19e